MTPGWNVNHSVLFVDSATVIMCLTPCYLGTVLNILQTRSVVRAQQSRAM